MANNSTNSTGISLVTLKNGKQIIGQEIDGGNGIDTIVANDIFTSTDSKLKYVIVGGNGNDTVIGSSRDEIIWGDSNGNSGSISDNGADNLSGGGGNDEIHGGNADDRISGDLGADSLYGDKGADRFVYSLVSDSNASNGAWSAATGD